MLRGSKRYLENRDIGVVDRVIEGYCGDDGDCREIDVLVLLHLCKVLSEFCQASGVGREPLIVPS